MKKILPRDVTSYDLVKTFAVAFMIIDHVGYFFFPQNEWWRVFGRLCVPVWFFLIGYARSRDMGPKMWLAMAVLLVSDIVAGMSFFPLNIIATMLVIRATIDPLMRWGLKNAWRFWGIAIILALMAIPTNYYLFEYGTLAITMAIYGYLLRHHDQSDISKNLIAQYFVFAVINFLAFQDMAFNFTQPQFLTLGAATMAVLGVLSVFQPAIFPRVTAALPAPVAALLRLTGRHTLFIYVAHLLLFKALAVYFEPARFVLFHWKWYSPTGN